VIGFFLYQLTLKADELSQALRLKEETVVLTREPQALVADEMLPRLNSLGETLSELKHELHEIKLDQKKASQPQDKNGLEKSVPLVMPVPMNNDHVAALKNDFKLIHNGTRDSTVSHVAKQDPGPLNTQPTSRNKTKTVKKEDVPNKLVVNLVSLTNREKAQAAYDTLIQAGVSPLIEEVVVNDRRVYRLSVDGFDSRESAQAFISNVSKKYGFEGGWIRQN
jgi:cell division septation protein DedD